MSKYEPLSERLRAHGDDEWRASFSDVEQVLGFALPKGARTGRKWWANDPDKSHSRAWAGQGWEVGEIDPVAETVIFRRSAASPAVIQQVAGLEPLAEDATVEGLATAAAPNPPAATGAQAEPRPRAGRGAATPKGLGVGALVAGGLALVVGIGAVAARTLVRRR